MLSSWFGLGVIAFRVRPAALDELLDALATHGRLVASDTPTTPIGSLPGTQVMTREFFESGARAITWTDDVAILVDPTFCLDLVASAPDETDPRHATLCALSRHWDVLVVWHQRGDGALRSYRGGACDRDLAVVAGDAGRDHGAALAGESSDGIEATLRGVLRSFAGPVADHLADASYAIYDTDLATMRRFGGRGEWGRGLTAVLVRDAGPRLLDVARRLFERVEPTNEPSTDALTASMDHCFADITAMGAAGTHALFAPGYYASLDLDDLAARLKDEHALVVHWNQNALDESWFALLDHGRAHKASVTDTSMFETHLRRVVLADFGASIAWLFGPTVQLQRVTFEG